MAARHPRDRFVWIDVEDEDELVGDLDIETFPTVLVGTRQRVLFFGTVLPSPELLSRLLAQVIRDFDQDFAHTLVRNMPRHFPRYHHVYPMANGMTVLISKRAGPVIDAPIA